MGETQPQESEVLITFSAAELSSSCPKERRNGMWNIFEGIDSSVLEKLGLSQEMVRQLVAGADDRVSERLSQLATHLTRETSDSSCKCERARIYRSFSASVGEEMQAALQNRHRRNAVGNLFDILTPSQKLVLVERLQEQLDGLSCLCEVNGNGNGKGAADNTFSGKSSPVNHEILLSLADLAVSAVSSSSAAASPRSPVSCP